MINKAEKKKIIAACGKSYSRELQKHLAEKGILNTKGQQFSMDQIRSWVNGLSENEAAELEILSYAAQKIKDKKKIAAKRKALF